MIMKNGDLALVGTFDISNIKKNAEVARAAIGNAAKQIEDFSKKASKSAKKNFNFGKEKIVDAEFTEGLDRTNEGMKSIIDTFQKFKGEVQSNANLTKFGNELTEAFGKDKAAGYITQFKKFNDEIMKQQQLVDSLKTDFKGAMGTDQGADVAKQLEMESNKLNLLKDDYASFVNDTGKKLQKHRDNLKKNKKEFAGWAMSIMFFGMALKRTFDSIWKSSTKTFQDVMHSVEGSVTGFDMLEGSLAYLGFTVGQALEPVADYLIPIVWAMAEWVEENEGLVRTVVVALGILGTLFMLIGSGKLAFDGLSTAAGLLGPALGKVGSAIAGLSGSTLAIIAAALLAIYFILDNDIGGVWEVLKENWEIFLNYFKGLWEAVTQILSGVIEFLEGVFTGDFDKSLQGLIKIIDGFKDLAIVAFLSLAAMLGNIILGLVNIIKDLLLNLYRWVIDGLEWVAQAAVDMWNKVRGWFGKEPLDVNVDFSAAYSGIEDLKDSLQLPYIKAETVQAAIDAAKEATEMVPEEEKDFESFHEYMYSINNPQMSTQYGKGIAGDQSTQYNNYYFNGLEGQQPLQGEPIQDYLARVQSIAESNQ